jgi:presenilin-like A22 family membrane protease
VTGGKLKRNNNFSNMDLNIFSALVVALFIMLAVKLIKKFIQLPLIKIFVLLSLCMCIFTWIAIARMLQEIDLEEYFEASNKSSTH